MASEAYTEMIMEQLDHSDIKEHIERYGYYSIKLGNLQIDLRSSNYTIHYVSELSLIMVDSKIPMSEWVEIFLPHLAQKPFIDSVSFYKEQSGFDFPSAFSIDCEWFRRDWFDQRENLRAFVAERITAVAPLFRRLIEDRIVAKHQYVEWKTKFYSHYYKGNKS